MPIMVFAITSARAPSSTRSRALPNDAKPIAYLGSVDRRQGRWEGVPIRDFNRATELDRG